MPKHRAFYSFHYVPDNWRAATVRNIGAIEGNKPAPDNDWETVKKGGDKAIKKWIADQMKGRSCTVVWAIHLAPAHTISSGQRFLLAISR